MTTAHTTTPTMHSSFFDTGIAEEMERIDNAIRGLAYSLFRNRDGKLGSPFEDWLQAEKELLTPTEFSVEDRGSKVSLRIKVPGFSKDDLKVKLDGNQFTLCGTVKQEQTSHGDQKQNMRSIRAVIDLPSEVETSKPNYEVKNGVFTMTLEKRAAEAKKTAA